MLQISYSGDYNLLKHCKISEGKIILLKKETEFVYYEYVKKKPSKLHRIIVMNRFRNYN